MFLRWRTLRATHSLRLWFDAIWQHHADTARPANEEVKGFSFGAYNGLDSHGDTIEFNTPDHACRQAPLRLTRWTRDGSVTSYEIDLCFNKALVVQVRIPTNGLTVRRCVYYDHRPPDVSVLSPWQYPGLLADLNRTYCICHVVLRPSLRLVRAP